MAKKRAAEGQHGGDENEQTLKKTTGNDYTTRFSSGKPDTPPQENAITSKQVSFLSVLINRRGKGAYQDAKARLGFPQLTIMKLSKRQAAALIQDLAGRGK